MKLTLAVFVCVFLMMPPAFARTKKISAAPEAPGGKPGIVASSVSLHVVTASNGAAASGSTTSAGAARATTTHSAGIQIGIMNLGLSAETVAVRWFWVGRYEKSRNWFRAGDGEKAVTLDPKKSENLFAASGDIENHVTKSKTSQYKSGGHMTGWVVTASNAKGELIAVRASDSYLEGFASQPPPKQR